MRIKRRMREISFCKLEEIKVRMNFKWNEVADLLGVSSSQVCLYRRCGKLPASRYYAVKDALLAQHISRYKDEVSMIEELFN